MTQVHPAVKAQRGRRHRLPFYLVAGAVVVAGLSIISYARHNDVTAKRPDVVVKILETSRYGDILVTRSGYALYTYSEDTKDHSNCIAFCLQIWPPFVVANGIIPAGDDVAGLGTFIRDGGEHQVTYHGKPLYFFAYDHFPGRTSGEGNGWSVVQLN